MGMLTSTDVFEQVRTAAVQATAPDERALQIDYDSLRRQIDAALGDRRVVQVHINRYLPEGYEEQGRFNVLVLTAGHVLYDMVIGDSYFRYDIVSVTDLDKIQIVDALWENREKRQEEPFLSLRLMHAEEAHLLLALDDRQRQDVLAFARAVSEARHPER
jgi:hypothetical protein